MAFSAQQTWDEACAKCHGSTGDGKTKEASKRHIKDYTDPKVQEAFSDVGLLKNLLLGIRNESGEERMPSYKDKMTVPEAKELIVLIRSFKKTRER